MSRAELTKLQEDVAKLEDALQVTEFTIKQDAAGNWPAYDPEWRFKMIVLKQGRDGAWPPYNDLLGNNCDMVIERLSFGHDKVHFSEPPYFKHDKHPAAKADFQQRREADARKKAAATNQQVPLGDPEKLS